MKCLNMVEYSDKYDVKQRSVNIFADVSREMNICLVNMNIILYCLLFQ